MKKSDLLKVLNEVEGDPNIVIGCGDPSCNNCIVIPHTCIDGQVLQVVPVDYETVCPGCGAESPDVW
jgi:Ni,Fe-hydrogenase III small subunit